ncbi:hypothetical protein [Leifsonia xyli]|uniref:hypothetical protein n=1 Tax=Leifsonia xyli TaxID=1575 RepID=UPI003D66BCC6
MSIDEAAAGPGGTVRRGPSSASRRAGYAIAIAINVLLLWAVEVWPGWRSFGVLTPDAAAVIPWVDAALIASIVVNLLNLIFDRRWLKAVGDLVTSGIGLIAAVVIWDVFPFDFSSVGDTWAVIVRIFLILAIVGSAIAIIVALVTLVRLLVVRPDRRDGTRSAP